MNETFLQIPFSTRAYYYGLDSFQNKSHPVHLSVKQNNLMNGMSIVIQLMDELVLTKHLFSSLLSSLRYAIQNHKNKTATAVTHSKCYTYIGLLSPSTHLALVLCVFCQSLIFRCVSHCGELSLRIMSTTKDDPL